MRYSSIHAVSLALLPRPLLVVLLFTLSPPLTLAQTEIAPTPSGVIDPTGWTDHDEGRGGEVIDALDDPVSLEITSPTDGQQFTTPNAVIFEAAASDDSGIAAVWFNIFTADDMTSVDSHTAFNWPYTYSWGPSSLLQQGDNDTEYYILRVSAWAHDGGTAVQEIAFSLHDIPPTVELTSPENEQWFAVGELIELSALAQDENGSVSHVYFETTGGSTGFWGEGTDLGQGQFSLSCTMGVGYYTLQATAWDNESRHTSSDYRFFSVAEVEVSPSVIFINKGQIGEIAIATNPEGGVDQLTCSIENPTVANITQQPTNENPIICIEGLKGGYTFLDVCLSNTVFIYPVYVIEIDLDVNNNGTITDAVDGVANYLPGYVGNDAVLTTVDHYTNILTFTPQLLNIIVDGIEIGDEVDDILFSINESTAYPACCENAGYQPSTSNIDDFSFSRDDDNRGEISGESPSGCTLASLWGKDYGGKCVVTIDFVKDNIVIYTTALTIPQDNDDDMIADCWERSKVEEWNNQYQENNSVDIWFFDTASDIECLDADNGGIVGGRNLPPHKAAGDGRTAFAEYRGYLLDGGGFDWNGANGHQGGHTRLSPAFKELLVEVDVMADAPNQTIMPDRNTMITLMDTVSKGYSDKTKGAGIRLSYIIDSVDNTATTYDAFIQTANPYAEADVYSTAQRNILLSASRFVHVQMINYFDGQKTSGMSWGTGSCACAYVQGMADADTMGIKATYPSALIAHEIHHTMITEQGDLPNRSQEHFDDTSGNSIGAEYCDTTYVLWNYQYQYGGKNLTDNISSTDTTIPLLSTTNMVAPGTILIGLEYISYNTIDGLQLKGCQRGIWKSTATAHNQFDDVTVVNSFDDFKRIYFGDGTIKYISIQ